MTDLLVLFLGFILDLGEWLGIHRTPSAEEFPGKWRRSGKGRDPPPDDLGER